MRTEPQPSDREVLAGLVERVTYQNAENGFCVIRVKARGHRDLVTVVGHAAVISAGEWITASGDWMNDRTHGQQFKARFLKTSAPTSLDGIEKYLASGMIRGIGPVYAKKLLARSARRCSTSSRRSPTACGRWTASDRCGQAHQGRLGRAEGRPRDHGVPAQPRGRHGRAVRIYKTYGADAIVQVSRRPLPPGPRHPRHRFQDGRRDRNEAWHRQDSMIRVRG